VNEPASPSAIVIQMLIGSGPGSASRARAPTINPQIARKMISPSIGLLLRPEAVQQTPTGGFVLGILEDARVVELLEQAQVVRRVLGRVAPVDVR